MKKLPTLPVGGWGILVVLASLAASPQAAQSVVSDDPNSLEAARRAMTPQQREAEIRATLDRTTSLEFLDTPLGEAMDFVADFHNIPILLDERHLTDAGIARDEPINLTIGPVSLRSALRLVLEPLELTYVIEDEVLKITTREQAEKRLRTVAYDVSQMPYSPEALIEVITATVAGGQWKEVGGPAFAVWLPVADDKGSVSDAAADVPKADGPKKVVEKPSRTASSRNGRLVIAQTEEGHDQIARLLKALAESPPPAAKPMPGATPE